MLAVIGAGAVLAALAGYGAGWWRLRRRGVRWRAGRTWCVVGGAGCAAAAVAPPVASHDGVFAVHVAQHLLLGMAAPGLLALSAPVTLALRTLPPGPRRLLLRLAHSLPVRVLASPATAVVLSLGGSYALYLSGLYQASERNELLHAAVHLHMFAAGCLLSWAVIGVDPIRGRPPVPVRLAALVATAAGHDTLAKLLYARGLPAGAGRLAARHTGAGLLYYGGTVIDLALAVIVMTQWYLVTGRALARSRRRATTSPGPPRAPQSP